MKVQGHLPDSSTAMILGEVTMAYFNLDKQENPILEIQRILRSIDYFENEVARIRLTGNFDEETRQGVRDFQKKYGLPVTGTVDFATWQLLQAVDRALKDASALARAVYILPRQADYSLSKGLRDDVVYVIQHMINVISQEYDGITPLEFSGLFDDNLENAIKEFQRKNLIEESGVIDAQTFNRLADEYERINSYNE